MPASDCRVRRHDPGDLLVKRGLFEKVSGLMGSGYKITQAGKSAAKEFMGEFSTMALGESADMITTISD
jgi:hypothetical protein